MSKNEKTSDGGNAVWGAKAIGQVIGRTAEQVRELHRKGVLEGAVVKKGHRTLVGNRTKLQQYPNTDDAA